MAATVQGADDSLFEASAFERALARRPARWIGWRRRLLMVMALTACLSLFGLIRLLTSSPTIDAQWQAGPQGRPVLVSAGDQALRPLVGATLLRVSTGSSEIAAHVLLSSASPRWTVDDRERVAAIQARQAMNQLLDADKITLHFEGDRRVTISPRPRGHGGLGVAFWLLAVPALALTLIGGVVWLAKPVLPNALYALMTSCQAVSLLWIGVESSSIPMPVPAALVHDLPWRLGLDLTTAAAAVHAFTLYPRPIAWRWPLALSAWAIAMVTTVAAALGQVPHTWWLGQTAILMLGACALVALSKSYAEEPNPFAVVMLRFGFAALGTMIVVDVALVAAHWQPGIADNVAASAIIVWSLFFASLMALVPFLSRARRLLREFAMLAGLSTVATSLDLLFITVFSLEPFASLTLAVFIALAGYAAARQWILDQMIGSRALTTERTFEHLYRIAREVQKAPDRRAALLTQLLQSLFDPLEVLNVPRAIPRSRVLANGAAMVVPVRGEQEREPLSLVLRFSRRGRRIFSREDARLTDRVVDQLQRAAAYDQAVERGRTEERQRIAQDLHDDIGARLLTLMYKAQDPEIEDYLRHTLQDLKTLTRGLAASDHRLSHAVAEWKTDIQQRLSAAQIDLDWTFAFNDDPELGVVQWSALTRVLRELVSNAIYHARASRVEIEAHVSAGSLRLRVIDDGIGKNPEAWAHGLGLGGIRKRVKQLGGTVRWLENPTQGITCEVHIPEMLRR